MVLSQVVTPGGKMSAFQTSINQSRKAYTAVLWSPSTTFFPVSSASRAP